MHYYKNELGHLCQVDDQTWEIWKKIEPKLIQNEVIPGEPVKEKPVKNVVELPEKYQVLIEEEFEPKTEENVDSGNKRPRTASKRRRG